MEHSTTTIGLVIHWEMRKKDEGIEDHIYDFWVHIRRLFALVSVPRIRSRGLAGICKVLFRDACILWDHQPGDPSMEVVIFALEWL